MHHVLSRDCIAGMVLWGRGTARHLKVMDVKEPIKICRLSLNGAKDREWRSKGGDTIKRLWTIKSFTIHVNYTKAARTKGRELGRAYLNRIHWKPIISFKNTLKLYTKDAERHFSEWLPGTRTRRTPRHYTNNPLSCELADGRNDMIDSDIWC